MDGLFVPVCLFACGVGVVLIKHNKSTINDLYSFLTHHPQVSRKSRTFNENEDPKQLMTVAKSELCWDRLEFHSIKYKFPAVFIVVAGEDNKSGTKYVSEFIFGAEITTEESYDIFENSAILSNVAFMLIPSNPAAENILNHEDLIGAAEICTYCINNDEIFSPIPELCCNMLIVHKISKCNTIDELTKLEKEIIRIYNLVKIGEHGLMKDNLRRDHVIIANLQSKQLMEYHDIIKMSIRTHFRQAECYSTPGLFEKFKKVKNLFVNQGKNSSPAAIIQVASRKKQYTPELIVIEEHESYFTIRLQFLFAFQVCEVHIQTLPNYYLQLSGKILDNEFYKQWEYSTPVTSNQYLKFIKPYKDNLIYFISTDERNNLLSMNITLEKLNSHKIIDV